MADHILVLGALGGVGRAVAAAFHAAGWQVSGLVRRGRAGDLPDWIWPVEADLFDAPAVVAAVGGPVDAVFDGLNVRYDRWADEAVPLFAAGLAIAEALGATHLFPGNVYNFGAGMPAVLTPDVPFAPTTVKGRVRVDVEALFAAAARERGVQTIVVRAGDFFGPTAGGSWIGALVAKGARRGVIRSPGAVDAPHAYAYLPDLARALVALAEKRAMLGPYEVFHFAGHTASMKELAAAATRAFGRPVRVRRLPGFVFTLLGWFSPVIAAAGEMAYLWSVPHRLADDRLATIVGVLPATDLAAALAASV